MNIKVLAIKKKQKQKTMARKKSYSKSHLPKYANLVTGDVFQVFVSVLCYFSGLKFFFIL